MPRPPYAGRFHYFIGGRTRALLLERLITDPHHRPYFRELARGVRAGMGALHRELVELERMGLVKSNAVGGLRFYEVDPCHPLFEPLRSLIEACEAMDALPRFEFDDLTEEPVRGALTDRDVVVAKGARSARCSGISKGVS